MQVQQIFILDIDYESYLFDEMYDEESAAVRKLRKEFEYLFFILNKDAHSTLKTYYVNYGLTYLNNLKLKGFKLPKLDPHARAPYSYYWGHRHDKTVEMLLNSKITSALIGFKNNWGFYKGKLVESIDDVKSHIYDQAHESIDCWMVKQPQGFSGRGNKYIWKSKFDESLVESLLALSKTQGIDSNYNKLHNNLHSKLKCEEFYLCAPCDNNGHDCYSVGWQSALNSVDMISSSCTDSAGACGAMVLLEPVYERLFDIGTTFEFDVNGHMVRQFMVENFISSSDSFQGGCAARNLKEFQQYIMYKYQYCLLELEVITQSIKEIYVKLGAVSNIQIDSFVYIDRSCCCESAGAGGAQPRLRLYPLVEVNYRKTMGLVIQSLADRLLSAPAADTPTYDALDGSCYCGSTSSSISSSSIQILDWRLVSSKDMHSSSCSRDSIDHNNKCNFNNSSSFSRTSKRHSFDLSSYTQLSPPSHSCSSGSSDDRSMHSFYKISTIHRNEAIEAIERITSA